METQTPAKLNLKGEIVPITDLKLSNDDNFIRVRASDTTEIERHFGYIVLSHDPQHLSLDRFNSDTANFIKDHDTTKVDNVLGIILNAEIIEQALYVDVKLSCRDEVAGIVSDIKSGIIKSVSIGTKITEILNHFEDADGNDHFVMSHEPYELSLVVDPAIPTAQIELKEDNDLKTGSQSSEDLSNLKVGSQSDIKEVEKEEIKLSKKDLKMADLTATEVLEKERKRVIELSAISTTHKIDATEAIAQGYTISEFQTQVLKAIESKVPEIQAPKEVGLTKKENENFSVLKAMKAAASGDWSQAGLEREASIEAATLSGQTVGNNSFVMPSEIQAASVSANPGLVPTERLSFVESLFANTLLDKLNTTNLFDLMGDYEAPKMSGTSVGWVGEDVAGTPSDISSSLITLSPKTAVGIVPVTHKMLNQNSVSIENQIRNLLSRSMAKGIDSAVLFTGNGSTAPAALSATAGINSIDATAGLTWALITQAYKELMLDDVSDNAMFWLSNPTVVNALQNILRSTGDTASNFILNGSKDDLNGYPVIQSSVVPVDKLVFGDFSKLYVGTWNTPRIDVNPYGKFSDGGIDMRIMTDIDSAVAETSAFCVIENI